MKCKIDFQNINSDQKIKDYINGKIITEVAKFYDDPTTTVDVVLKDINGPKGGIDKEVNTVITIAKQASPIKITEVKREIFEAIDLTKDRINKILRRLKEKNLDKIRNK